MRYLEIANMTLTFINGNNGWNSSYSKIRMVNRSILLNFSWGIPGSLLSYCWETIHSMTLHMLVIFIRPIPTGWRRLWVIKLHYFPWGNLKDRFLDFDEFKPGKTRSLNEVVHTCKKEWNRLTLTSHLLWWAWAHRHYLILKKNMRVTPRVLPPVSLCWPAMSEVCQDPWDQYVAEDEFLGLHH